jgi:hypothetical protein
LGAQLPYSPWVAKRKFDKQVLADEMTSHKRWEDFLAFHDENPMVFEWLLEEAQDSLAKGYRLSIAYLWERLRAEGPVEIESLGGDFVLDNEFTPLYARALIYEDPSLGNYLQTRKVAASP